MNNWEGCQGAHISTCKQQGKRAEITEERAREKHSEVRDFYGAGKKGRTPVRWSDWGPPKFNCSPSIARLFSPLPGWRVKLKAHKWRLFIASWNVKVAKVGPLCAVYHVIITEAAALSAVNAHQSGAAQCKDSRLHARHLTQGCGLFFFFTFDFLFHCDSCDIYVIDTRLSCLHR